MIFQSHMVLSDSQRYPEKICQIKYEDWKEKCVLFSDWYFPIRGFSEMQMRQKMKFTEFKPFK